MNIIICDSVLELNQKVADIFIAAVKKNPSIILGLATGSSPIGIYKNLVADYKNNQTDYKNVQTFNLDEYIGLEPTHSQSYRQFMNNNLLTLINIDLKNTYVPSGLGDHEQVCKQYDQSIVDAGGIDIQILGIGSNGHIAFNEPGTSFDSTTHVTKLTQETIASNARFFTSAADVPNKAVTMGIKSILKAKKIILIAIGTNKAAAINALINGPMTEELTASALQNHPDVTIYLDQDAAKLLDK